MHDRYRLTFFFLPERTPFFPDHTNFKTSPFLSGLRYMEQSSEFPPETRRILQAETGFFVVLSTYVNPDQTPRLLSPVKLSKSSRGAPGSGAPGYGRTFAHLIDFSRCGLKLFFRCFASHTQLRS